MTMSFLFLMPLTFASNIFVELGTMPPWLQAIVRHNPITHLTDASRALMHGTDATVHVAWVLGASRRHRRCQRPRSRCGCIIKER